MRPLHCLAALGAVGLAVVAFLLGQMRGNAAKLERRVEQRTVELSSATATCSVRKPNSSTPVTTPAPADRAKSEFLANMSHEIRDAP